MLFSSCATLCFHIPLCWALVSQLKLGSIGATVFTGSSYWLNVFLLGIHSPNKKQYLITRIYATLLSQQVSPTHLWYPHITRRHFVDSQIRYRHLSYGKRENIFICNMCVIAWITEKILIFLLYPKAQWINYNIEKSIKGKTV